MGKTNKKFFLSILIIGSVLNMGAQYGEAAPVSAPPASPRGIGYNDAGVQLNRTKEYLERERVAKQIAEDKARRHQQVEEEKGKDQGQVEADLKFPVKEIKVGHSEVLQANEISKITADYIGKEATLKDLYGLVEKINALYAQKGYLTCKATLPPQTIKAGVVTINLVEGKTGTVTVEGNKSTRAPYIKHRMHLKENRVDNVHHLNSDLLRFNAGNDVQLRITMKAGEKLGTTDYVIKAYEPKQHNFTIYTDNGGSTSTGEWRYGAFYTNRSLTGVRDALSLGTLNSQGLKSFTASYGRQLGRSGTRMDLNYNTNSLHVTDGSLEPLNVRGHAYSLTAKVTQPLKVTEHTRIETSLEYNKQNSKTNFLGIPWIDDDLNDGTLSYAVTQYGDSSVLYQKYGYAYGSYTNIDGDSKNFGRFLFNGLYQKLYQHGQMLNMRLDGQWTSKDYLPSGRQFYIGGAYSVRGYKESLLSGDKGFCYSFEYGVPVIAKGTTAFAFVDYGVVYGESAFEDNALASYGVGIKSTIGKNLFLSLTLGIPIKKDINGEDIDSTRLHFVATCQL